MVGLLGNYDIGGMTSNLVVGLSWLVVIIAISGLAWFIVWWNSYKIIFIIRIVAGNRTATIFDRAKIIRKQGKPIRWKLRRRREFVPVPPKQAIDITTKGKEFVEAYYTEDGEYHYIVDIHHKDKHIGSLNPITSSDKEFYAQQVEEGEKYKHKTLGEIMLQIAPILAIVIILVVFMVMFDNVVKPSIEMGNSLQGVAHSLQLAIESMNSCVQNVQIAPN